MSPRRVAALLASTALLLAGGASTAAVPTSPITPKIIGMSAPANLWDQRVGEVGACGIEARRIFADLNSTGGTLQNLVREAVADGQMPVVSYKVPDPARLASGGYDSWITAARNFLNSLGVQVTATYHHEPHGDMTAAQFRSASLRFVDRIKSPTIAVGPILNGYLLDSQTSTFASYTNRTLLTKWDFVAVDTYQPENQSKMPGRAVPLLETWLDGQGFPDKPIGVGEYNGWTAEAIAYAGEVFLSTPELWFALVWNSQVSGGLGSPLTGDRLAAFQATKADARAKHDPPC